MFYYFARINSLNIVIEVQRVEDYNCTDYLGNFSEVVATEFCAKIFGHLPGDRWIRTAKDGSIRRQFAGKNHTYDAENDRFLPPKHMEPGYSMKQHMNMKHRTQLQN